MVRVEFAEAVGLDIERIADHLLAHEASDIEAQIDAIFEACAVLKRHPLIGRRADDGLRELVIGHGTRGFVTLYDYAADAELVLVPAVKAQPEAGYGREWGLRRCIVRVRLSSRHSMNTGVPVLQLRQRPTMPLEFDFVQRVETDSHNLLFITPWERTQHEGVVHFPDFHDFRHFIVEAGPGVQASGFATLQGCRSQHRAVESKRIVLQSKGQGVGRPSRLRPLLR